MPVTISPEIIELCLLFYDTIIQWTIKDTELEIFFKCTNNESMNGPRFTVRDIPMRLELYPNSSTEWIDGYTDLIFIVETETIKHFISSADMYIN